VLITPEEVTTREQFASFIEALRTDLLENESAWENPTLERFLEALASYVQDIPGYIKNTRSAVDPEVPSWQLFAVAFHGARIYE
jgi:hypothetical protein